MAAKVAALKEAISSGKDILGDMGEIVDKALAFYGKFEGALEFRDRHRSLELTVVNACRYTLEFDSEHFDSGTWFVSPQPLVIEPGNISVLYVADRQGSFCCGVSGGLKYRIAGSGKCLYVGFTNPHMGCYKTFVDVTGGSEGPQYAYDNSQDDTVKQKNAGGFRVTCTLKEGKKSPFKNFQYTIEDN